MDPVHSPLIECRHCGNSERSAGWDRSTDLTCTMCRSVILPADPALAAKRAARMAAEETANAAKDPMKRLHRLTGSLANLGVDPLSDEIDGGTAPEPPPPAPTPPRASRMVDQVLEMKARRKAEQAVGLEEESLSVAETPDWETDRHEGLAMPQAASEKRAAKKHRRKKWILKQQGAANPGSLKLPAWTGQAMAGFGGLIMAGLLLWLVVSILSSRSRSVGPAGGSGAGDGSSLGSDKIIQLARQFAEAKTTEERLKLVRDPQKMKPLVEAYHPTIGFGKLRQIKPFGGGTDGSSPYEIFMATYDDEHSRLVCVLTTPEGLRVDWEAFSRQGTVTPEQLADGTAVKGEVRVLGSPSNYYNYRFNDDKKWLALQLSNSDWKDALTGYARVGSPEAEILRRVWNDPRVTYRLLLEIETDGDSGTQGQVVIKRVLALGWVRGTVAADEATSSHPGASEISTSVLPFGANEGPDAPRPTNSIEAPGGTPSRD